jgi:NAD(P)-dependent dehydrogenase (short-subunit alcohol dehydrogenase family)
MEGLKVDQLFSVKGKYVLVTGGGRGIGQMITEGFAANGATVFITSRNEQACVDSARTISAKTGGRVIALPASDLATYEGVQKCAVATREALQRERGAVALDVLVNNSGVSWGEPLETFPEKGWDKVMDTNVKGIFFLTQALLPALRKAAESTSHASIMCGERENPSFVLFGSQIESAMSVRLRG